MYNDFPGVDRAWIDRCILATPEAVRLQARAYQVYNAPHTDIMAWLLGRIRWRGDEHVLDVGCGAGSYLAAIQYYIPRGRLVLGDITLDLLHQMYEPADLPPERLCFDAQHLPFPDNTFDVVMANHLLHQVPYIPRALDEMRRVLRPSGKLIVAASSGEHRLRLGGRQARFSDLYRRAYALLGVPDTWRYSLPMRTLRFQLENGAAQLSRHFNIVIRYDLPTTLQFPNIDAVLTYLESTRLVHERTLPADLAWEALVEILKIQIKQMIEYFGKMAIDKMLGVFVATNAAELASSPPWC